MSRLETRRVAIITGGARGIGLGISERLATDGFTVVGWDLPGSIQSVEAQAMTERFGERLKFAHVDVGVESQVIRGVDTVIDRFGRIDVLVNNAGISPKTDGQRTPPEETTTDEWELVIRVNLTSQFWTIRSVVPHMKARGWGRIINISSRAARSGAVVAGLPYGAAKTGVNGITRTLAPVLGPHGITINSIAPGWIYTPMTDFAPKSEQERRIAATPMRRPGQPADIAGLVAYLCSDDASFLTGDTIDMNGGSYMAP